MQDDDTEIAFRKLFRHARDEVRRRAYLRDRDCPPPGIRRTPVARGKRVRRPGAGEPRKEID